MIILWVISYKRACILWELFFTFTFWDNFQNVFSWQIIHQIKKHLNIQFKRQLLFLISLVKNTYRFVLNMSNTVSVYFLGHTKHLVYGGVRVAWLFSFQCSDFVVFWYIFVIYHGFGNFSLKYEFRLLIILSSVFFL